MTTRADVEDWVRRYIDAWASNDAGEIGGLFTEDARYFTAPYRQPWSGRDGIVEGWLGRKDEQGEWRFSWEVLGVDGEIGFVKGVTTYTEGDYSNLWVIRMAEDGRASEFTEYWMLDEEDEEEE